MKFLNLSFIIHWRVFSRCNHDVIYHNLFHNCEWNAPCYGCNSSHRLDQSKELFMSEVSYYFVSTSKVSIVFLVLSIYISSFHKSAKSNWPILGWNISKSWLQKENFFENYAFVAIQSDNSTFYACKITKGTSGFNMKQTNFFTRWHQNQLIRSLCKK